ncbi:MAG: hypothetical protein ABI282_06410, partial [Candidatus Baltobacteraceae bacterium]
SSLTGIFAPGSPALTESLRTLVLEPSRIVAPDDVICASFSFSNLGGAAATGARVRFTHPRGIEHVTGADLADDCPLEEGTSFVDANGAEIGSIEPNAARVVVCTFRVDETIEDGSELIFQAALATDQTPLVASNIERLVVRSRSDLRSSETLVTIVAPQSPKPGDLLTVRAKIVNSGSSSANDVTLVLPVPEHTAYVAQSARIDGRVVSGIEGEAFDYDRMPVVSARLGSGHAALVEYQVTIDSPLADGTRIKAAGNVGSRESSEFRVASSEIVVHSPVDFEGEETALTILCDDVVTPGMRVPMTLRVTNAGTGSAERVQIAFVLPEGLIYAPGSAHVDGQPVSDDSIPDLVFSPGTLAAARAIEVGLAATVAVPSAGVTSLPVEASLRWRNGERRFVRRLTVRVASRFGRARNFVEVDRGVTQARDDVTFTVHLYNDGTAPEANVRLKLIPGLHLDEIRVSEGSEEFASYVEPLDLGTVEPHSERIFTVVARTGSRVPDRSSASLGVILEHDSGAIDLGTATVIVRSRPAIESARWELASHEALRPGRTIDALVRIANGGTDVLRDARLVLAMPADLAMERAVDARRDRDGVLFADIAPGTTHEARITLRLLRAVPNGVPLTIDGWLIAKGTNRVRLDPLEVTAFSEPQFAQSAQMTANPAETINSGDRLRYEVRVRNDGDGPAERLTVRVVPTNLAVYVPSSTTINGMAVGDDSGMSQLWSQRGLVLADVNPNVELRLRFEMVVMSPLAAGTPLESRAVLEWADGITHGISAPAVRVQARPSLGESSSGTPISIARIFAADGPEYEAAPLPEPQDADRIQAEAPDQPPRAIADLIASRPLVPAAEADRPTPVLYADFTAERLANTIRMIERSDAGGIVQHIFAMRMLLPDRAAGATPQFNASFAAAAVALRAPLEKLFVRLRMPRLSITGKDIEDRESRDALRNVLGDLALVPSGSPSAPARDLVRVEGAIELDVVRSLHVELESAPLGAVTPWLINAQLLGTTTYHDGERSDSLETYRAELLNVFSVLAELPMVEFHRVLTSSVNRNLDEALGSVLDALRGAAHIARE